MEQVGQSLKPFSEKASGPTPPSGGPPTCSHSKAAKWAAALIACYRRQDGDDPETFARAVIHVLTGYPEVVVAAVCNPRAGLPVKCKFLPTIYEIDDACKAQMRPILAEQERRKREAEKAAEAKREISPEEAARRKEVVRKHYEGLMSEGAVDMNASDARKVKDDAIREKIVDYWDGRFEDNALMYARKPVVLSNEARATLGLPALKVDAAE